MPSRRRTRIRSQIQGTTYTRLKYIYTQFEVNVQSGQGRAHAATRDVHAYTLHWIAAVKKDESSRKLMHPPAGPTTYFNKIKKIIKK